MADQIYTRRNYFLFFHARSGVFNVHTIVLDKLSNSSDEHMFFGDRTAIARMVILTYINIYTLYGKCTLNSSRFFTPKPYRYHVQRHDVNR